MYMDNLSKIYERSYVYIPSFYDADDVLANVNKMVYIFIDLWVKLRSCLDRVIHKEYV